MTIESLKLDCCQYLNFMVSFQCERNRFVLEMIKLKDPWLLEMHRYLPPKSSTYTLLTLHVSLSSITMFILSEFSPNTFLSEQLTFCICLESIPWSACN